MNPKRKINIGEVNFHERLKYELSSYIEKTIQSDGSVTTNRVDNPYFLMNNNWNIKFLKSIPQFQKMADNYKGKRRNVHFRINSPTVNLEIKYVWYQKLFKEQWALSSGFNQKAALLTKLSIFLNEKYPHLPSLFELDMEKTEREWLFWLEQHGIPTTKTSKTTMFDGYTHKSPAATYFRIIHSNFLVLADSRNEWEKDRWDVRILHSKYGIYYSKSLTAHFLDFTKIEPMKIKDSTKKYIKQRLMGRQNLSFATARVYSRTLTKFFSFIFSLEPTWNDLKALKRSHMELYIQWFHEDTKNKRIENPERYISEGLKIISKFLGDIQKYEYDIAPTTNVRLLIFPGDKPKVKKKPYGQIDYIPDFVLEQLFAHLNELHKDIIPVVWVAFKTGLRISDVLELTTDCLVQLNGKYSIVTDIEKTFVQGHRIPIDEELAKILSVLISNSKENSTQDNNPEKFIFVRYQGIRKGKPYTQAWIRKHLNELAKKKNIVDENGDIFRFKTHQFRHTYAVKLLNGGADILTVQELLAHASPEMTLRYAKLLDETKRKAFESVINQGVFSFDLNGEVQKINAGEDIPEDILQALWQEHKLNAMDNPYGTCHARLKGDCPHMEAPPCLTCNSGSPCKDLAIGFSELDIEKYELHIKTTTRAVKVAKQHNRDDMVEKHERNLNRYQGILNNIREGNIIFGRQDRIKRKYGVKHG
ncbi:transposase [Bacillus cereus]|uniref:tyrosine-type recombinase/integrase n=1 Tax=Bacillus cereus group TaxID=86661 RepID=UPI0007725383|nr:MULTISPECIES: tyrosine-type recombinase/integrase [Bacillus cereus group]KXI83127.1 transposase [Bacillus cereus]MCC3686673.1 tyrosine-type recombinase/integrase [Bacillus cereus]MDA2738772.1 tyrosine-type recombinase/integrase [Bacillus cereus group sp. Bc015]